MSQASPELPATIPDSRLELGALCAQGSAPLPVLWAPMPLPVVGILQTCSSVQSLQRGQACSVESCEQFSFFCAAALQMHGEGAAAARPQPIRAASTYRRCGGAGLNLLLEAPLSPRAVAVWEDMPD